MTNYEQQMLAQAKLQSRLLLDILDVAVTDSMNTIPEWAKKSRTVYANKIGYAEAEYKRVMLEAKES